MPRIVYLVTKSVFLGVKLFSHKLLSSVLFFEFVDVSELIFGKY